jgi:hypothetical protein
VNVNMHLSEIKGAAAYAFVCVICSPESAAVRAAAPVPPSTDIFVTADTSQPSAAASAGGAQLPPLSSRSAPVGSAAASRPQAPAAAPVLGQSAPAVVPGGARLNGAEQLEAVALNGNGKVVSVGRR